MLTALFFEVALAIGEAPIKPPKEISLFSSGPADFVCLGLKWLFTAAIIFSIVLALVAAYEYMTSAGDPGKVKQATNRLIFVAIGIAVAILARSMPVLVGSLLGAERSTDTSAWCR